MADNFTIEAFTLLSLAVVVIGVRTGARLSMVGIRNFQADDYLMPLAAVVYGLETGAAYCVGAKWKGVANNSMTDAQRAALSPDSEEFFLRVGGSKTQIMGWSLYTLLLWLLKACMAVFYSRLTSGLMNMKLRIRLAYVFIGVTYVAVICSILFGCHPMHKNWQIYPNPGIYCQPAVSPIDVYMTVTLNVATDLYLITIPAPMLFKARLPWWEKCELLILFSGGFFVMAAGILRCVLIITAGANGAQQAGSWACRETFVAVVIGNVPMIYPVIRRVARRANSYISSLGGGTSDNLSYPMTGDRYNTDKSNQSRRKKFRHPLSLPGESQWINTMNNDEQMILPTSRQHPPTCESNMHDQDWDAASQRSQDGIKVVHETIVQSKTRNMV